MTCILLFIFFSIPNLKVQPFSVIYRSLRRHTIFLQFKQLFFMSQCSKAYSKVKISFILLIVQVILVHIYSKSAHSQDILSHKRSNYSELSMGTFQQTEYTYKQHWILCTDLALAIGQQPDNIIDSLEAYLLYILARTNRKKKISDSRSCREDKANEASYSEKV